MNTVTDYPRRLRAWNARAILGIASIVATGCGRDYASLAPLPDASQVYAKFQLANHSLNLTTSASYDTMHVQVTARFADGSSVPGRVQFSTTDSTIDVDSSGLVTARFPTSSPAFVRAFLTYGSLTRYDSALVQVTTGVPLGRPRRVVLSTLPDSQPVVPVWWRSETDGSLGSGYQQLVVTTLDAQGNVVPGLVSSMTSSNPDIATVDATGIITALRVGTTVITATVSAFGTTVQDTLTIATDRQRYMDTYLNVETSPSGAPRRIFWFPDTLRISVGGTVAWGTAQTHIPVDVKFDSPEKALAGNAIPGLTTPTGPGDIPAFSIPDSPDCDIVCKLTNGFFARSFLEPGVYPFHSTLNEAHGVVIVCKVGEPCP